MIPLEHSFQPNCFCGCSVSYKFVCGGFFSSGLVCLSQSKLTVSRVAGVCVGEQSHGLAFFSFVFEMSRLSFTEHSLSF